MKRHLSWEERFKRYIKRQKKRSLRHSIIGLVITFLFIQMFNLKTDAVTVPEHEGEKPLLTASLVGDLMFGRNVQKVVERYGYDHLFQYVAPYFEASDYVSGNFEQAIVLRDDVQKADKFIHLSVADDAVLKTLKEHNFTVLNLANNHAMDFLEEGMEDTINAFKRAGLDFVGAGMNTEEASRISYHVINGFTVATLGFTDVYTREFPAGEKRPGVLTADPSTLLEMIYEADQTADLVMVHIHWGLEYDSSIHARQKAFAQAMVEAGADVIIGHHPHVLLSVDIYENSVIFYSLGNFIFDQGWTRTRESAIAQIKWYGDGTARVELIPTLITEATPKPLTGPFGLYHQERIIRQLTKESNSEWTREEGKLVFQFNSPLPTPLQTEETKMQWKESDLYWY